MKKPPSIPPPTSAPADLQHPAPLITKHPPVDFKKIPAKRSAATVHINTSPENVKKINERERRTQVLRKLPPSTTTNDIIDALTSALVMLNQNEDDDQFASAHLPDIVSSVFRDVNDRRRWYITFSSHDTKLKFASGGYHIGDTHVPPEYGDVHAFIPNPPYYLGEDDLLAILKPFGEVAHYHSICTSGVRTGAFHFDLNLKESAHLPEYLSVDGHMFQIIDKGSLMQCTSCHNFGHIRRECRKLAPQRLASLEARAEDELRVQQQEEEERQSQRDQREQERLRQERVSDSFSHLMNNPPANQIASQVQDATPSPQPTPPAASPPGSTTLPTPSTTSAGTTPDPEPANVIVGGAPPRVEPVAHFDPSGSKRDRSVTSSEDGSTTSAAKTSATLEKRPRSHSLLSQVSSDFPQDNDGGDHLVMDISSGASSNEEEDEEEDDEEDDNPDDRRPTRSLFKKYVDWSADLEYEAYVTVHSHLIANWGEEHAARARACTDWLGAFEYTRSLTLTPPNEHLQDNDEIDKKVDNFHLKLQTRRSYSIGIDANTLQALQSFVVMLQAEQDKQEHATNFTDPRYNSLFKPEKKTSQEKDAEE